MSEHRPRLVLLPGFDGSARLFEPLLQSVGDRVAGCAIAYPPEPQWGYEHLLPFVVDSLPAGASVVLGESFSGPLAAMVAAAVPERVTAVVLVASFSRLPLPAWLGGMAGRLDGSRAPRWFVEHWLTSRATPSSMRDELFRQVRSLSPALVSTRLRAALRVDVRDLLDGLRCPILALHGQQDRLIPPWWARLDLGRRHGVEFHAVDGPHMLLQSSPRAVAARLLDWMDCRHLRPVV